MYKIAIVQNEKELFKYDCADWSKLIVTNASLAYYQCEYYDEHNVGDLFEKITLFDAIFLATNALNSQYIYTACVENREKIEKFINTNHGFYVGYSSKNKERGFLPIGYRYEQIERDFTKETEFEGDLAFLSHHITRMYNEVNCQEYSLVANNHMTIAGLYFDYIKWDKNLQNYDSVIEDAQNDRALLLCSKQIVNSRVVVTTLPVDWQMHYELFNNIVRYCTEGLPNVDIISQEGSHTNFFSQEYLFRQLSTARKPFKCSILKEPSDLLKLYFHSEVIVFDSTWDEASIDGFCASQKEYIVSNKLRVLHYHKQGNEGLYKLTVHSAFQQIDIAEKELLAFLESKCPDKKQKYSYDSSLLATYEALKVLQENKLYNSALYKKIIETGKKRLLPDGSYDAMFVASCMFAAIWTMCDANCKNDEEYVKLLNYTNNIIRQHRDGISNYEKAQALYYLSGQDLIDKTLYVKLLEDVKLCVKEVNQNNLMSYGMSNCWKVLSNTNLTIELKSAIMQAIRQLSFSFDSIIETVKLPIISNYLFSISAMIQHGSLCLSEEDERIVYGFLFDATEFLNRNIGAGHIENDVYSSCLVIEALKKFYSLSIYPTDEIISLVSFKVDSETNKESTLTEANGILASCKMISEELFKTKEELLSLHIQQKELSGKLKEETDTVNKVKEQLTISIKECEELKEKNLKQKKELNRRNLFSIIKSIALVIVIFVAIQMGFVYFNDKEIFVAYFSSFYRFADWCALATGIVIAVIEIIKYIKNKE